MATTPTKAHLLFPSPSPHSLPLRPHSLSFPSISSAPVHTKSTKFRAERRLGSVLSVRCGAVRFVGPSEFGAEVLQADLPVLVDFVADWCGPCKLIAPTIDWASQEYEGRIKVVKIDHDANPQLIEEYKVYGLPTLILFKDGKEVPQSRREGAITKAKLKEYLDSLLNSLSVA